MDRVSVTARTKLPLVLWIGAAVFIAYGTTIPFNFISDRAALFQHMSRVVWNPLISPDTRHRVSIPDFVSNLLTDRLDERMVTTAGPIAHKLVSDR